MTRKRFAHIALAGLLAITGSGCVARHIRIQENGLTCADAYRTAIATVRRLAYTITDTAKPSPGAPGFIRATRSAGTTTQGLIVSIFCTTIGAEIEAATEEGGLAQMGLTEEFQRSFETAARAVPPPRAAPESGLDVLVTPERGGATGSPGLLPVSVRITNHTPRAYRFRVADVILQTDTGERVVALMLTDVAKQAGGAADALRAKALGDSNIAPNQTVTGYLYFPFKSYVRARVTLTDQASDEPEGFSIEF